ncbi:uncharacterized protein METZ01_LOCUS125187, partial [marine metagenome]
RLFSSIKEKNLPGLNDFSQSTGLENGSTVIFFINFASTLFPENNSKEKARKNIKYDFENIFLVKVSITVNIDS